MGKESKYHALPACKQVIAEIMREAEISRQGIKQQKVLKSRKRRRYFIFLSWDLRPSCARVCSYFFTLMPHKKFSGEKCESIPKKNVATAGCMSLFWHWRKSLHEFAFKPNFLFLRYVGWNWIKKYYDAFVVLLVQNKNFPGIFCFFFTLIIHVSDLHINGALKLLLLT